MAEDRITILIDYLKGTCHSLDDACETFGFQEDDLTPEELEQLDEEIFCCGTCDWWHESDEACGYDANMCESCYE